MKCRICKGFNLETFLDLGLSPIANDLLDELDSPDPKYPLETKVCLDCSLVQLPEVISREHIFSENYVYFSSYSKSWLAHAQNYAEKMINELTLSAKSLVVEVASNDGYLLQYFSERGVPVLGVEPAEGVAAVARTQRKIPTVTAFFGELTAEAILQEYGKAQLIAANNVLAHVPDIHDFVAGFKLLLSDSGVITFEFPHVLNLIRNSQFDTIYHEHFSYLSVQALNYLFIEHKLKIFKVEELKTHGGSLRVYVGHDDDGRVVDESVQKTIRAELDFDPRSKEVQENIRVQVGDIKLVLNKVLTEAKQQGLRVAGYGAAAKGNTLLNFAGISNTHLDYVVDLNPSKQNRVLPGSHIRVVDEKYLIEYPPDVLLILPWNLSDEIIPQVKKYGLTELRFLRAIPKVEFIS